MLEIEDFEKIPIKAQIQKKTDKNRVKFVGHACF
jgi:hypothetical protein